MLQSLRLFQGQWPAADGAEGCVSTRGLPCYEWCPLQLYEVDSLSYSERIPILLGSEFLTDHYPRRHRDPPSDTRRSKGTLSRKKFIAGNANVDNQRSVSRKLVHVCTGLCTSTYTM